MTTMRTISNAFARGTNPLTIGEAGRIADIIVWNLEGHNDDDISRLLLLCHAFTYERDLNARGRVCSAPSKRRSACACPASTLWWRQRCTANSTCSVKGGAR